MSIFALYLRPMEAHLVTDTMGFYADKSAAFPTAKAIAIPHLRLAVGFRGSGNMLIEIYRVLIHTPLPHGIDDVIGQARTLTLAAAGLCSEQGDDKNPREILSSIELIFVGWSEQHNTMRAVGVTSANEFSVQPVPMNDLFAGPPTPFNFRNTSKLRVPEDLVKYAIAQKEAIDKDPEAQGRCGGELWMVTLKPRSLKWSCIHQFREQVG